ncbi:amino acid ABC transporter permease [Pseudochrobactrum asaccharolyticum]|jgi:polar amino acid transport system permease protein|uniref:Amino acid ABC transporter membrane protein 2 (PAAT family) n=1 Tax=Pseudochrobactrum asaccharolyticum TaxID=354351 RepID=A0A366DM89_9HYPH|nr:amino acid ABC transporter permease [Pseudochrobactrum asaccharolyticum]MBX8801982.1 amino acid ABC transporter permease [Ochrobactrum sp. MR28]MBX8818250.1 amino acid ABC transporter permease [Ochrobactrum sp. MR31]MCF7672769.1 amino acid ABC transporter permease [Bacillus subtilis]MDR2310627.1 amino acid ABC transporter permease [Brucellaceae bacterium]MCF7646630.1 amino acid ABC transporter permease [Pseudochrobactrum asaccharolyticum]
MELDFSIVPPYTELLLTGFYWTLIIAVSAGIVSFIGGILFALLVLYAPAVIRYPLRFFMWLFMGTPLLLQLFLLYYGLSQVGINIPALWTGIIGLGLHFAVYNADIFRTSILTVDVGQTEGARSIGFSNVQTLRYVIVPQAVRNALPQAGNNLIALLKDTAIVSVLGITELVHASQQAISETYSPFEFYITAAVMFYILNLILEAGLHWMEKKVEAYR